MYGTSDESDGSCVNAVDVTDLSPDVRYLLSGSHFRLSASLLASFVPQFNANGAVDDVDGMVRRFVRMVRLMIKGIKLGFMLCYEGGE